MRYLYQNKYWPINEEYNLDKLLYLIIDRPNHIDKYYGDLFWVNDKKQDHRNYDLPSYIKNYNDKIYVDKIYVGLYWYKNGKSYRKNNKPYHIILYDGFKLF